MHEAIILQCDTPILKLLKNEKYDIDRTDPASNTPLFLACKHDNQVAQEFLLRYQSEVFPSFWNQDKFFFKYLPIHHICRNSHEQKGYEKILDRMLLVAAEHNYLKELLVACDELGNNSLHTALTNKQYSLQKFF